MAIYIHREGQQYGPYSIEEAHEYIASGELMADDLAWNEGAFAWLPLAQVIAASEPAEARQPAWVPPRRDGSGPLAKISPSPDSASDAVAGAPPALTPPEQVTPGNPSKPQKEPRFINPYRTRGLWIAATGGAIFIGGLLGMALIHVEAASKTGGWTHLVAWGAIIFGGVQCLSGIIQAVRD